MNRVDPLPILIGGAVALLGIMLALSTFRTGTSEMLRDYEAEADMESHDIDDMLDAINERRRRGGRRDIGEELSDELIRGDWE